MATRTPEAKRKDDAYQAEPAQVAKRVARNKARGDALKAGKVHKGDGKDIDHKKMLKDGGSNAPSNLRVVDASTNRAWRKGKTGY